MVAAIISGTSNILSESSTEYSCSRSSCSLMFYRKSVLENFAKFMGECLIGVSFLIKLQETMTQVLSSEFCEILLGKYHCPNQKQLQPRKHQGSVTNVVQVSLFLLPLTHYHSIMNVDTDYKEAFYLISMIQNCTGCKIYHLLFCKALWNELFPSW